MTKQIIVDDCVFTTDRFFREGVDAFERGVSFHLNPYRQGSHRAMQWDAGYSTAEEQND